MMPQPLTAKALPDIRRHILHSLRPGGYYETIYEMAHADPERFKNVGQIVPADGLRQTVDGAALWFVAPDAVDMIAQAAPSLPDESSLDPETIGVLDGTSAVLVAYGGGGIESVTWVEDEGEPAFPLRILIAVPVLDPVTGKPSVSLSWMAPLPFDDQNIHSEEWTVVVASIWEQNTPITSIPLGHPYVSESDMEDRRVFLATLALIQQDRVLDSRTERPSRQVRRAIERSGGDAALDDVRICDLRGSARSSRTEAQYQEGRYKHRWVVGGHWRSQPYGPKRSLRRPVWIAPHMKGPAGAPILTGEKVKVLR